MDIIVAFISFSTMNEVEHFFMYLLTFYLFLYLTVHVFSHLSNGLFNIYILRGELFVIEKISPSIYIL